MDRNYSRYDEPYGRPRRKANLFGWTIAILLLIGLAFAAWLGSYYIFNQPERPESYRILQKLHKIEQPKRFQLTAAPAGEFLNGKQLHDRYGAMRPAELARANAELARNYIRNFQSIRGQIPYVVGRYTIMDSSELTSHDLFTSGMVALTNAVDFGELLMEHVYPADEQSVPQMKEALLPGLELKLDRSHDLTAVIHAERLTDGRVLITAVPLLYGSYTMTQGRGTFSLEPPFDLNMKAGFPLFKEAARRAAEASFATFREHNAPVGGQTVIIPGLAPVPSATAVPNELVRVETAIALVTPTIVPVASGSPTPKGGKLAKNQKGQASPTPMAVVAASVSPRKPAVVPSATPIPSAAPVVAVASPSAPPAVPTLQRIPPVTGDTALTSTAGGGTWKTYPAGKMPTGRLITTSDLGDVADRGLAGERVYLRGQFVVNFAESNRAVLRPSRKLADSVLHFGAPSSTRIIVEFPSGVTPPAQGSTVTRDEARPYEITEVRKQSDGQLNVFVREIMQ
ncbi:MAG: hypothetical protein M3Y03_04815 [Verrucomicrobiota bacterium]|nr:hypothetical protein [Verrucomicrobiota bacterium]